MKPTDLTHSEYILTIGALFHTAMLFRDRDLDDRAEAYTSLAHRFLQESVDADKSSAELETIATAAAAGRRFLLPEAPA